MVQRKGLLNCSFKINTFGCFRTRSLICEPLGLIDDGGGVEGICSGIDLIDSHLNPWSTGVFKQIALSVRSGARCDAWLRYDPAIVPFI